MNDSSQFLKVKRGRPCKNRVQDCLGDNILLQMRISEPEAQFQNLQNDYIKNNFNQKIRNMIQQFLVVFRSKLEYNVSLLVISEKVIKELMVSEIEFAAFVVIFSRINFDIVKIHYEELIKICIFSVKIKIDSGKEILNIIEARLKLEIIDFSQKLIEFIPDYDIAAREINHWLNRLSESYHKASIDYSFYVYDIIRLSPPYKLAPKRPKVYKQKFEVERKIDCFEESKSKIKKIEEIFIKNNISNDEIEYWEPEIDLEYELDKLN